MDSERLVCLARELAAVDGAMAAIQDGCSRPCPEYCRFIIETGSGNFSLSVTGKPLSPDTGSEFTAGFYKLLLSYKVSLESEIKRIVRP